jgi:glycosyltransferase involved in cell wall biosynthesis
MDNAAARFGAGGSWQVEGEWTVLMPFFNERHYLRETIRSLAGQTVRPLLILIDNASTDRSAEVAREACAEFGIEAVHLYESRPGKVAALQCGLRHVQSRFVATCDADTWYPAGYLAEAGRLLDRPGTVAAIAANSAPGSSARAARLAGWRMALSGAVLRQQCLNGGASQTFRTAALKACGGFDPAIWNWVLEDHEIMARIEGHGRIRYSRRFICHPASRPRAVDCRGWNLGEQLRYHCTDSGERVAYFHGFLAPRLRERALPSEMLRRTEGLTANA